MPQKILRLKVIKFLELTRPEESQDLIKKLSEKKGGLCFSLSLQDAIMDLEEIDQLLGWENILVEATLWDEQLNSLETILHPPQGSPIKLREVFEKIVKDVITNQLLETDNNLTQENLLDPNGNFTIIDRNNQVRKIQHQSFYPGNFTAEQLNHLLQPEDFTNNIGLLHSVNHTLRIGYKNKQWIIYDANYDHTNKKKIIHKTFAAKDKHKFIKEIKDQFKLMGCGDELAIHIASTRQTLKPYLIIQRYEKLLETNPEQLLTGFGLHLMLRYNPSRLQQLCREKPGLLAKSTTIKVNLQDRDNHNRTPLHLAVRLGISDVVNELLACKDIDVNLQNDEKRTALRVAAYYGYEDIVTSLLNCKDIDVNLQDSNQWTPLHVAIYKNQTNIVARLLAHKNTDVNRQDNGQWTGLHLAVCNGQENIVAQLLAHKDIDVNLQNDQQWTPLHSASHYGSQNILIQLLAHPAIDVNLQNDQQWTALHLAILNNSIEIVELLVARKDTTIDASGNNNFTPLQLAVQTGNYAMTKLLLDHDASINTECIGPTDYLLDLAEKRNCKNEIIHFFKDENNNLPQHIIFSTLHLAVFFGHTEIVSLLLRKGADVNHHLANGPILDIARIMGYKEIEKLIENHLNIEKKENLLGNNKSVLFQPSDRSASINDGEFLTTKEDFRQLFK